MASHRFLRILLQVPSKWVVSQSAAIMKTRGMLLHQICGVSTPPSSPLLRRGAHHITSIPPINTTQLSYVAIREECGSHINQNDSSVEMLRLPTQIRRSTDEVSRLMAAQPHPLSPPEMCALLHIVPKWVSACDDIVRPSDLNGRVLCQELRPILPLYFGAGGLIRNTKHG
jgi:hypothetical protein